MDSTQKLIIDQIDRRLRDFKSVRNPLVPGKGWIYSIRIALKMSMRQLGNRLKITPQSVKEIEEREVNGSITINSLREAGEALDMKLFYGFIPKKEGIDKMIEERAFEIAKEIVLRTSQTMMLEDRENIQERLDSAIREKAMEIKNTMPKYLWE
ncbi:MAG: mobile mystery protein A [Bacteroidota bacterium]|nr:mobile mystery protein A [Bacteroidota bacterium]